MCCLANMLIPQSGTSCANKIQILAASHQLRTLNLELRTIVNGKNNSNILYRNPF